MMDLLHAQDPAANIVIDSDRLRSKIDERLGMAAPLVATAPPTRRPWVRALVAVALLIAVFVPFFAIDRDPEPEVTDVVHATPGFAVELTLGAGGVKTMAVSGNTIWFASALQHTLTEVDAVSGSVLSTTTIDDTVEGVVVGGGKVWLTGYDNGTTVLRFDPENRTVDATLALTGSFATGSHWFDGRLWVSTDDGQVHQVSADARLIASEPGQVKGEGLGYLWFADPDTGLLTSIAEGGSRGDVVVPMDGTITPTADGLRMVTGAGGFLWLMDDDFPNGSAVTRYDPVAGSLQPVHITTSLIDMVEFGGDLWISSLLDGVIARLDVNSGDVELFAVPGRPGALLVADGALWMATNQPGSLSRVDPAGLLRSGTRTVDVAIDTDRLLCTGQSDGSGSGQTVLLDANSWLGPGSWSMLQAELSARGVTSCAHGIDPSVSPVERAGRLEELLAASGLQGPFVLVAAVDGVHSTRAFAAGRDDISGMILVDPVPLGFEATYNELTGEVGHPPWLDVDAEVAAGFGDLGDVPLTIIGHDPSAVFGARQFEEMVGTAAAGRLTRIWDEGLTFYTTLSSNSRSVTVDAAFDAIAWTRYPVIADEVILLLTG